jgi:hypothetical protein
VTKFKPDFSRRRTAEVRVAEAGIIRLRHGYSVTGRSRLQSITDYSGFKASEVAWDEVLASVRISASVWVWE